MINTKTVIFLLLTLPWREAVEHVEGNCGRMATQMQLSPARSQFHHKNVHLLPGADKCGRSNPAIAPRIWDGKPVHNSFDYPWMAKTSFKGKGSGKINCGGTIINEKYILTAAHCCERMHVGRSVWYLGSKHLTEYEQIVTIMTTIIHPNFTYCQTDVKHDLCLTRVDEEIRYSANIQPICFPLPPSYGSGRITKGERVEMAGWGRTNDNERKPQTLQVKTVSVLDDCHETLSAVVDAREICVPAGMCTGDSGGPLMKSVPDRQVHAPRIYYLYGVASMTTDKCDTGRGAYTRVTEYIDWILDYMRP